MEKEAVKLTKKDFDSGQDVRWCPGCGDYAILATMQKTLAELGLKPENVVVISGIGCSSRFPYYMNTYGMHTIHGRAPAFATGLKLQRPELSVWLITGDGDGLSIGGNHLAHLCRRNLDLNVLLFNNEIYGLTKGQFSPTSRLGTKTKSSPEGSNDFPMDAASFTMGCGVSFFARVVDTDAKNLADILKTAENHRGTSIIELLQNCPVFNDGIHDNVREKNQAKENRLYLTDGEKVLFGPKKTKGVILKGFDLKVVDLEQNPELEAEVIRYDSKNKVLATLFTSLGKKTGDPVPLGVLFQENRPSYDKLVNQNLGNIISKDDLNGVLQSGEHWTVA